MQNQISNNWQKLKFGEVATLHRGYDLPIEKMTNGKYPVIFSNGKIEYHNQYKIKGPGVITGRSGSLGNTFYIEKDYWPHNTTLYVSDFHENNPKFIYYLLKTLDFSSLNAGSGVPTLNRNHVHEIPLKMPIDHEIQKKIASLLSAFDDKIEINNKIAKTLEEMAQTIFKEWFVKFQFPGYKKVEFIDSDLGKIPEGWKISTLKDIVDLKNNRYAKNNIKDRIPYLPIDLIQSKTLLLKETAPVEDAKSSLIKFFENDILFGAMRPYFFKVSIAPFMGLSRTTCFVFRPKTRDLFGYASFVFFRQETIDYATNLSQGSTIPYAKWNGALAEMQILEPSLELLQLFNAISLPVIEKIKNIYFENEKLSALRDLLLPKLMRGEIRV